VAFEAVPGKVRFLRRKFPEVDVRDVALSDQAGSATFYLNRDATGYSGLAPNPEGRFQRFEVSCVRLDDVVPRDRRFDFVKIDVEGAELLVLRGAPQFLARDRPVVLFECGPRGPSAFGDPPAAIYNFLTGECGYSIFFLKDALGNGAPVTLAEFENALVYPFKAFNWIGIPKGSPPGPTPGHM
jgi:FkbM family methyltransferase